MNRRTQFGLIVSATLLMTLMVTAPAQATITHRYSFTTNANDSAGTANWTNNGGATFSSGQVNFDGVDDFLSLGATPLPASGSMTMEIWGTYATNTAVGSRIFDFSNAAGDAYLYLTPRATPGTPTGHTQDSPLPGSNTRWRWDDINTLPDLGPMASSPDNTGQEVLLTVVFDSTGSGEFRLYRDGALIATDPAEGFPILSPLAGLNMIRLGHGTSVPYATAVAPAVPIADLPAFLTGSLNEVRVYNNVLTPLEVLTNLISGPDVTSVSFTDKSWTAGSSNWNTGANWGGSVPAVGDRATIGNAGTASVSSAVPQAGALTITNGTLSVGSGGSLSVKYPIQLNTGASNSATINVTGGGVLSVAGILPEASTGTKTINIDGGTIRPGFKSALVLNGATTVIGAGGATFETQGTDSITWSSSLSGSGNITKTGTGTLFLRPPTIQLALEAQNPNYSGEVFINEGTVDIQREHGVFGTAGSTLGGKVHLNNSTLVINTAYPINLRKELPADLVVAGNNLIRNMVDRVGTEIEMMGSLSGNGTLEFIKPLLADTLGLDFENRDVPSLVPIDNSGFTGRIVVNGNWAIRFSGARLDPDMVPNSGDEVPYYKVDLPNGILEITNPGPGSRIGKRGDDPNQTIRLGGLAGGGFYLPAGGTALEFARLGASVAGPGDALASVTYQIGGASQNANFSGNVSNGELDGAWGTDIVTIVKVGNNTQTFSGPNSYSGTTTVNGGTLLINGRHSRDAREMFVGMIGETSYPGMPEPLDVTVGDYTVNSGGTLGGSGTIGQSSDPVDVIVNGGTIAPGASVGTLTSFGNVTFGANSHFGIELSGATADQLAVTGNIDLTALGNALDVTGSGSGSWVIATYTGSRTGTFESVTSGFTVDYGTGSNSQITLMGSVVTGVIGDYNNDNKVNAADYTVWRNSLGAAGSSLQHRDPANGTGAVTVADYNSWKTHFGETSPGSGGGAIAAPEPASFVLLGLGATLLGIRRRRDLAQPI